MINENNITFKDRSGGLKAFGVVLIVLGAFDLLMIPTALMGSIMARSMGGGQSTGYWAFSLSVNILTYLFLGGIFLWTGIDSIRLKRWVRPVLLSIGWVWLLLGIMITALIFIVMPRMMGYFMPPEASVPSNIINIVIAISGTISFIFMVLLPGLLVWFYSQNAIKQTLEAKDPSPAWTDSCPSSVLALSLFYGVSALLTLLTSFLGVSFFCGLVLRGPLAVMITISNAFIMGYICYSFYRLDILGWWIAVVSTLFWTISSILLFSGKNAGKMVELMGQGDQFHYVREGMFLMMKYQGYILLLSAIPLIGYLLYVKKYFNRS